MGLELVEGNDEQRKDTEIEKFVGQWWTLVRGLRSPHDIPPDLT